MQYNAMLAGIFHLIAARQNELKAEKEYLDAHRDYYTARAELERAAGVRMSPPPAPGLDTRRSSSSPEGVSRRGATRPPGEGEKKETK